MLFYSAGNSAVELIIGLRAFDHRLISTSAERHIERLTGSVLTFSQRFGTKSDTYRKRGGAFPEFQFTDAVKHAEAFGTYLDKAALLHDQHIPVTRQLAAYAVYA